MEGGTHGRRYLYGFIELPQESAIHPKRLWLSGVCEIEIRYLINGNKVYFHLILHPMLGF